MPKEKTTKWEGGGTYIDGECDIPSCHNLPNWRNWDKDPCGFNGDDELLASLCNKHKSYKSFNTTEEIIKRYGKSKNNK